MGITSLGHVGIHVNDMERSKAFYAELLGLKVNDESERMIFMSAQDRLAEHHELVLARGRVDGVIVQQISFRCASLQDVRDFYRKFLDHGVTINRVVSHGNAIGLYFQDPDGNNIEVYYPTNIDWPQPFGVPVDLINDTDAEILNAHLTKEYTPNR
jgi:catechol-2,3-dioxygenase